MQTTLLFIITTSNRVFPTGGWGVSPTSREFAQSPPPPGKISRSRLTTTTKFLFRHTKG